MQAQGSILVATKPSDGLLPRYALFGAALAFAGPPIYIHTPNLYVSQHGMSLAAVGAVLLGLRVLDFVQDPLLGWWMSRTQIARRWLVAGFAVVLGIGALALFAPEPLFDAGWWLALSLVLVFTGFSALQILVYSTGVRIASDRGQDHSRIAGWREAGILLGITAASVAPTLLAAAFGERLAYPVFGVLFCLFLAAAAFGMHARWGLSAKQMKDSGPDGSPVQAVGFSALFQDGGVRQLLVVGLFNALPTGLTATLFVFFVQDRLQASGHEGPALLLFFLAAAIAAPLWTKAAARIGAKRTLLTGMTAAIAIFLFALTLGPGDWPAFYAVCIASGAMLGADMTLLPAMLSRRLANRGLSSDQAFGLWGFINKASLALAAGLALPALDYVGFKPGGENDAAALTALAIAYAAVPSGLKALAGLILFFTKIDEGKG